MSFKNKKRSESSGTKLPGVCPVTGASNADSQNSQEPLKQQPQTNVTSHDLSAVRADLRKALRCPGHDDGSLAPLFIRFAWHCSGTYDKDKRSGGSNGGTMRFRAEQADPENSGLEKARMALEKVHRKHNYLSLADIFVLGGYVAFEATGGPVIPFSTGRRDFSQEEAKEVHGSSGCPFGDGVHNPIGSRLPAADLGPDLSCPASSGVDKRERPTIDAVRGTFRRMGFTDKETVVLIVMGHQYGRMHPDVSGYEHTWYAFDPNNWNVYGPGGLGYLTTYAMQARNGLNPEHKNSKGKRQFSMRLGGGVFSMLPVDMALLWDAEYRKISLWYDRHRLEFHLDAAAAWKKLTELGCDGLLNPETTPGHDQFHIDHML